MQVDNRRAIKRNNIGLIYRYMDHLTWRLSAESRGIYIKMKGRHWAAVTNLGTGLWWWGATNTNMGVRPIEDGEFLPAFIVAFKKFKEQGLII